MCNFIRLVWFNSDTEQSPGSSVKLVEIDSFVKSIVDVDIADVWNNWISCKGVISILDEDKILR